MNLRSKNKSNLKRDKETARKGKCHGNVENLLNYVHRETVNS